MKKILNIILAMIITFFTLEAHSATFQTTAGGSGIWTDANNWVGGVAPTSLKDNDITIDHPIRYIGSISKDSTGNTSNLIINSTLEVTSTLTVSGAGNFFITGAGTLTASNLRFTLTTGTVSINPNMVLTNMVLNGTNGASFNGTISVSNNMSSNSPGAYTFNDPVTIDQQLIINNVDTDLTFNDNLEIKNDLTMTDGDLFTNSIALIQNEINISGMSIATFNDGFTSNNNVTVDGADAEISSQQNSSIDGNLNVINRGDVDFAADLSVTGNVLIDGTTSDLRVFGDFTGGGNVESKGSSGEIEFRGNAIIAGQVDVSEASNIEFHQYASITGNVNVSGTNAFIDMRGDSYTGNVSISNDAQVLGSGVLDYSSISITTGGSICSANPKGPGDAVADPVDLATCALGVLPIDLDFFTVFLDKKKLTFNWQTASETNNDFFTIEYSYDAENFMTLETEISGNGTTSQSIFYEYILEDYISTQKVIYFRLRQTDFDGKYSVSPIEIINFDDTEIERKIIGISPNPANNHVSISIESNYDTDIIYQVSLINTSNLTQNYNFNLIDGKLLINTNGLDKGVYFVQIEGIPEYSKLVIQ